MNSRGASLPPFVKPINHLRPRGSQDTTVLIVAACVAVALTAVICIVTAPTPTPTPATDDLTTFAAAADND
jgi:hypothetical protein